MRRSATGATAAALRGDAGSRAIGFVGDDARLVEALRERHPTAIAAFYDRFAPQSGTSIPTGSAFRSMLTPSRDNVGVSFDRAALAVTPR